MSDGKVIVPWDAGCAWHLVRHGETSWNRSRRIQGQTDVPLSRHGEAQAGLLGERLMDAEFSATYASDLSRTMQTARLIGAQPDVPFTSTPELREFDYGDWEGLTFAEAEALDPEGFAKRMMRLNADYSPPGGETARQVIERVGRFHDLVRPRHQSGENILVVGHGGSLLALLVCLLDLPIECMFRFRLNPASLSVVRTFGASGVLELWNDTSHLASLKD
jgi:broad specificity phosphatase PhoE